MNASEAWIKLITEIYKFGDDVEDNGTIEMLSHQSVIDMNYPIVTIPERELNYKFMFGEAEWILSGSNNVKDIYKYMRAISKFSDNGITFRGAYGPKIIDQLDYVTCSLLDNSSSRQAVLNIWRENPRPTKDYPCTLNMQWIIRANKLHCITNMRSSDVWLGWVYDVFNFSTISNWIFIMLKVKYNDLELGNLYLTAGSQHIYNRDVEKVVDIIDDHTIPDEFDGHLNLTGLDDPDEVRYALRNVAVNLKSTDTFSQVKCIAQNVLHD